MKSLTNFITKKNFISLIISFLIFINYNLFSVVDSLDIKDSNNILKTKILIAQIKFGTGLTGNLSESKAEAALALAAKLSGKFTCIPISIRDSVSEILKQKKIESTVSNIATELEAERIVFLNINQLKNMLRVELASFIPKLQGKLLRGIGYALLHYRSEKDDKELYDPTLLEALQRAFCVSEGDSMMYEKCKGSFRVFPAKTLVVGGLVFQDREDLPKWELFTKKEIISYDAVESIFEEARQSKDYVVWDIESRDSIYTLFNLYSISNYNAATTLELESLIRLDVDCYITGSFRRTENGADLEIYLCNIINNQLDFIRSVSASITKDDVEELRKITKELTKQLLKADDNQKH